MTNVTTKVCKTCKRELTLDNYNFYRSVTYKGKLYPPIPFTSCKDCCSKKAKAEYLKQYPTKEIIDLPCEIWRDVVGYEGFYKVSNFGRIKAVERMLPCTKTGKPDARKWRARLIKANLIGKSGYYVVSLSKGGIADNLSVHRIVAEAFHENPENKPQVNHKDGDKQNNQADNLEWSTRLENCAHAAKNNLYNSAKGERQHCAKLTSKEVLQIIELCKTKSQAKVGRIFNIGQPAIFNIMNGITWSHVTGIPKKRR